MALTQWQTRTQPGWIAMDLTLGTAMASAVMVALPLGPQVIIRRGQARGCASPARATSLFHAVLRHRILGHAVFRHGVLGRRVLRHGTFRHAVLRHSVFGH